ncbi:Zn-dependent protease with chaperone function [Micromonospora pattaloongensis]|uniref:Zn-dependent protease with chaperone function n=1 Tax=Micromonospora pattaloongensis TaxID=405436 RepID=A0A1H3R876_9ACTN|nr:M48 family metallopeptidase [Micromonospora pattaloongensis]SDZ21461.1 Zn-dependent protease with chaperone function [Micromonospora pattaloongensis]
MPVMIRALISVVMLAGFYVLALVQLIAGLAFAIWIGSVTSGVIAAKFGIAVFLATVWAVGYGTWKALRTKRPEPNGLPLPRTTAPYLWAMVDHLAAVVGTRPPDEIYLVPDVNAAVEERSKLMGLIAGRRYMYIGMPLLQAFTVAQLRSVLAHELGHYSGRHTRLAGVTYRGRMALERTISHIGSGNVAGWIFRGYGRLYVMVHNAVSRRQELEADLASVQVAGRDAAASALRESKALSAAFAFYLNRYVGPGLEAGYAPADLFAGFGELLRARADEIAELRTDQPDGEQSVWDTHPPLGIRLAAITAAPESAVPVDNRPAWVLIPAPDRAGIALQQRILNAEKLTVLPWDQFTAAAASARLQENMDGLLRTVSRAVNQPVPHVGAVLDHIAAGRLDDIAAPIFPEATRRESRKLFAKPLTALLSLAAVRSGAARWQHSWTGATRLVGPDGTELDLSDIAELAVDPATIEEARRQLAQRGIDVAAATHVEQRATARRAEIYAGILNMKVNKKRSDVLILSHGLLLVPSVAKLKAMTARRRMAQWIESGDPRPLATTEGNRFIAYEDIAVAQVVSKFPVKYELTLHNGEKVEIRWSTESEEQANGSEVLAQALRAANND